MGLRSLLSNPDSYTPGKGSKQLRYTSPPLLGERVTFDITDKNANPTFMYGIDHSPNNPTTEDLFSRGGFIVGGDRRKTDRKRIKAFYDTSKGFQWLTKQVALQALNPNFPQVYNPLHELNSTLKSVKNAGVGFDLIKRGGVGSIAGLDVVDLAGGGVDYLTHKKFKNSDNQRGGLLRENNYNLGDPGKKESIDSLKDLWNAVKSPFVADEGYAVKIDSKIDFLNALPIVVDSDETPKLSQDIVNASKDFIPFRFEVKTYDNLNKNHIIAFRAFLDSFSDNYSATHNEFNYSGRGENFYTYDKFNRKLDVSFKIAAQSRHEMKPLYQKLNYLVAQTAPNYSSQGRMRTPFMYLTVGDWCKRIPGVISSVDLKWQVNYPWEIALDKQINNETGEVSGKDKDMLILPHVLDVSVSFQPIHAFTPNNKYTTPFIGIEDWAGEDPLTEIPASPSGGSTFLGRLTTQLGF